MNSFLYRAPLLLVAFVLFAVTSLPAMAAKPTPYPTVVPSISQLPTHSDDPRVEPIIDRLIAGIKKLLRGDMSGVGDIWRAIKDLFIILKDTIFQIDRQVKASECKDRACKETGGTP